MKKAFFILGAMVFSVAAPVVSAEPAVSTPSVLSAQSAEESVVKRYIFTTAAKSMDMIADGTEQSDGSPLSQAKLLVSSLSILKESDLTGLPEECQSFIRESMEASEPMLDNLLKCIEAKEAGSMSEAEFLKKLLEISEESQKLQAAVEAKYPDAAKMIGQEATQKLTMALMPELQKRAEPRIQAYIAEHPEVAKDQKKLLAASLRVIAQLFREMAEEL